MGVAMEDLRSQCFLLLIINKVIKTVSIVHVVNIYLNQHQLQVNSSKQPLKRHHCRLQLRLHWFLKLFIEINID